MTQDHAIPPGFTPHFRQSPVTDPWEPLYSRVTDAAVEIGLRIDQAHCNARGMLHGGVMASLADNAMGLTYGQALTVPPQILTVSLSVDYMAAARLGDWLTVSPRLLRASKSMGFVDALLTAGDTPIARASGTFRNIV